MSLTAPSAFVGIDTETDAQVLGSELHADGEVTDLFTDNSEYDYRSRSPHFFQDGTHKRVFVTDNVREFKRVSGLSVVNWRSA